MNDIRIDTGVFQHLKIIRLFRLLGPEGFASLLRLWIWAAQNRPDGSLAGLDAEDLEIIADWRSEPKRFVETLACLRFLDSAETGFTLHNWEKRQPYAAQAPARIAQARAAAAARWKAVGSREDADSMPPACCQHADSNAPNLTKPNQKKKTLTRARARACSVRDSQAEHESFTAKELLATDERYVTFARHFQNEVSLTHGNTAPKVSEQLITNGARELEKAVRIDGFELEEVEKAMLWAIADPFWGQNVKSLASVRHKTKNGTSKLQEIVSRYRKQAHESPQVDRWAGAL